MSEAAGIIAQIAARRAARIRTLGHAMGSAVPGARTAPVVPFGAAPYLVCEVKRRSPSRGDIAAGRDAVEQAKVYAAAGVRSVSILTEQDHFGGSLDDLMAVKAALPGLSLLRKDFLLDVGDVAVSFRAGADAVLLIASLLDAAMLARMHAKATSLGMQALVELHDPADVEKCRGFAPELTGINCRDLATFSLDLLHPVALRPRVDWPARVIFESGIRSRDDVLLARSAGFDGVLVGEAAMRHPEKLPELAAALTGTVPGQFWPRLCARKSPGRPLVKICGITDASDGERAARLGADALGFIFAPSKRRAGTEVVRALRGLDVPKVGVVVTDRISGTPRLDPGVAELAAEGLLDVLQFHGDETPDECADLAWPYYKAVRLRGAADVDSLGAYRSPRVLVDAWSAYSAGGTGTRVEHGLAQAARSAGPLWIAGGIHDGNVGEVMNRLSPELIDASSGLESSPGRKDPVKLERFFEEIRRHEKV